MPFRVSVIIPARNEEETIGNLLNHASLSEADEVLVVDSGSSDQTAQRAKLFYPTIRGPPGRAAAMNAGASLAKGDVLLFLHADTRLPSGWKGFVARVLENPRVIGGAFNHLFDDARIHYRVLSWANSLRSRVTRHYYGDQAIFVRKEYFNSVGGFPDIFAEDLEFTKRMARDGLTIQVPLPVRVSPRLFHRRGFWPALLHYVHLRFRRMMGQI